jgi:hypothetical protein
MGGDGGNKRSMKYLLAIPALLAFIAFGAAPAFAITASFENASDTCAWVTYRTSGSELDPHGWRIQTAGMVLAGQTKTFSFAEKPQVQVGAEVSHNANCTGGNKTEIKIHKKQIMVKVTNADTKLSGPPYHLAFK